MLFSKSYVHFLSRQFIDSLHKHKRIPKLAKNINAITTKTTLFIKHLPSVPNFGTFLLVTETIQISVTTNHTYIHTYVHIHGNCIVYMYSPPCVFETTDFTDLYSNSARWYVLFFLIMIALFSNTLICIH